MKKSDISKLGQLNDSKACLSGARIYLSSIITLAIEFIYECRFNLGSTAVEHLLSASLLVPSKVCHELQQLIYYIWSIVSECICRKTQPYRLESTIMLVVDLMHNYELGVWKGIFTHLIQIYAAAPNGNLVMELYQRWPVQHTLAPNGDYIHRFHMVLTFGQSTIHWFASNTLEMKRLAAHNFEDPLQVSDILLIYKICWLITLC